MRLVSYFLLSVSGLMALSPPAVVAQPAKAPAVANDPELLEWVKESRSKFDMPAMGVAVVKLGEDPRIAVVGVRERGLAPAVTIEDKFHLGSNSKMISAMVMAALVEKGKLKWDMTLDKLFSTLAGKLPEEQRKATLAQTTSHLAGFAENPSADRLKLPKSGTPAEIRSNILPTLLSEKPLGPPGEKFTYSNMGFLIAVTGAEKAAKKSFEELLAEEVFRPLGMKSAGFGAAGRTTGAPDQPRGHTDKGEVYAKDTNPLWMAPIASIHCTLGDWSKFAVDFLKGTKGEKAKLSADSYKMLLDTPFKNKSYTVGAWGTGAGMFGHDGSNNLNMAKIILDPKGERAILIVANQGGRKALEACDSVALKILRPSKK